jgi:predicted SAM-dependent methyltransferase
MVKVNLGCGPNENPGYIGVDKVKLPTVDIVHDLDVYPYPFADMI